jgi:MFS family permease
MAAQHGLDRETASLLLSLLSASHVVSILLAGALSDRLGERLPLAGLAFGTAAGALLFAFGQGPAMLALSVILVGFGSSFWPLMAGAIAREFGPHAVGRVFGLATFFLPLASLAPFGLAKTQELTGGYAPALVALSLLGAATGAACLLLMRERPARPAEPLAAGGVAIGEG